MTLRIRYKLLLGLFAATALALLASYALTWQQLRSGFLGYIQELQDERYAPLAEALATIHAQEGGWGALTGAGRRWPNLLREFDLLDEQARRPGPGVGMGQPRPAPPPAGRNGDGRRPHGPPPGMGLAPSLTLTDAQGLRVTGPPLTDGLRSVPILGPTGVLGHIRYRPLQELEALGESAAGVFLQNQQRALLMALALALFMALGIALFMARRFEQPLRILTRGAQRLAGGQRTEPLQVRSGDEFETLAAAFNQLSAELEAEAVRRADWLMDVSHELRTPVAVLLGEVHALQDGVRSWSPERGASLAAELARLRALLDDFHAATMSAADAGATDFEPLAIAALLTEVTAHFQARFEAAHIDLRLAVSEDAKDIVIEGDRARLPQVFGNLFENTLRYTDGPGALAVSLWQDNGVRIRFADSSPGVPDADLARLAERFYRAEASRSRATGGSGLGLAICQRTVAAHGGTLSFSHGPAGGLQVDIRIPNA